MKHKIWIGAVAVVAASAVMAAIGFSLVPGPWDLARPSEASALNTRLSDAKAESLARALAQEELDRVTAQGGGREGPSPGQAFAFIAGRPVNAGDLKVVEKTFYPSSPNTTPVEVVSAVMKSREGGAPAGGATWLFVFETRDIDPPPGMTAWKPGESALQVEVVFSDITGKVVGASLRVG